MLFYVAPKVVKTLVKYLNLYILRGVYTLTYIYIYCLRPQYVYLFIGLFLEIVMKDNTQLCVEKVAGRIQYFYSCMHTYTDTYKTHRALKKHETPCPCGGGRTMRMVKADSKARALRRT